MTAQLEIVPGARSGTVAAAGCEIFYQEAGEGPVTICVHGNPDSGNLWRPLLERAQAGEIGRVIAPDMPGFGRSVASPQRTFGAAREDHARWFEDFVNGLGIDRYRLVVHDWGVCTILGALRIPDRCDAIVITDTLPFSTTWRWHMLGQVWRRRPLGEMLSWLNWGMPMIKLTGRMASKASAPYPGWSDEVAKYHGPKFLRAVRNIYRCGNLDELERIAEGEFHKFTCPTFVLWSDGDRFLPVKYGELWAQQLPNSRLTVIENGGGHWFFREDESVCDHIVNFLAESTPTVAEPADATP